MANDYYTVASVPTTQSRGTSSTVRSEYAAVSAGFDKLPTPAQVWGYSGNYAAAGGSVNAWTATIAATYLVGYVDGMQIRVKFAAANTTTTPTINLNSLGNKQIVAENGSNLGVGDIAAGMIATLTYNSTSGKFQMTSTAVASSSAASASATAAASSATAAASSATAAASSASAAATSETAAEAAATEARNIISPISMATKAAIRAYAGTAAMLLLTGYLALAAPDPVSGLFVRDEADVSTADDDGIVLVTSGGVRYKRQFTGPVVPDWFGAEGDGSTNDTTALQAAFTYAGTHGKVVAGTPGKTYSVTTVNAPNGIAGLDFTKSVIKGRGAATTSTSGVITLGSLATPLTKAKISVAMDAAAGDMQTIYGESTSDCEITGCVIYGFTNHATLNHYAIRLNGPCHRNVIAHNNIALYDTPTQRGFGIALYGTANAVTFGGFYAGAPVVAANPAIGNVISDNVITHGSYAISIQSCSYGTVKGNYCYNQNHRSIYCAVSSYHNDIVGNVLRDYLSSAVLLGYGAVSNHVAGNVCINSGATAGGEAAINITTGSPYNTVVGNKIDSNTNYGVYVATDSHSCSVLDNDISGQYLAAIMVENDWESPRPTNAIYSRPNYAAPDTGSVWSFVNMRDVVIKGNVIRAGYAGRSTAAIAIAQITTAANTQTKDIVIANNHVVSTDQVSYNLYLFAETAANMSGLKVIDNTFHSGNAVAAYNTAGTTTWNQSIAYYDNNEQLDKEIIGEEIAFTDADTTPSVSNNSPVPQERSFRFANTGATSVTDFDDGYEEQIILIRFDVNTTLVHDNSLLRLKNGINVSGRSTNDFIRLMLIGGIWIEIGRNWDTQPPSVSADIGDAAATLTVGNSAPTQRWASPITADRSAGLSTTNAFNGARFHIVRAATATGAFNVNVGTGPLKALAAGQWCDVEYDGSAWFLSRAGSL